MPQMIEEQFYVNHPEVRKICEEATKHIAGYLNESSLTAEETEIVRIFVENLMGEITDAEMTVISTLQTALVGRIESDVYRHKVAAMEM